MLHRLYSMIAKTVPYWLYWQTLQQMHNIWKNMFGYPDLIFEYLMSFFAEKNKNSIVQFCCFRCRQDVTFFCWAFTTTKKPLKFTMNIWRKKNMGHEKEAQKWGREMGHKNGNRNESQGFGNWAICKKSCLIFQARNMWPPLKMGGGVPPLEFINIQPPKGGPPFFSSFRKTQL